MSQLVVGKCPSDELSLTNCIICNERDFPEQSIKYVEVGTPNGKRCIFTLRPDRSMPVGQLGFSAPHRKWAGLSIGQPLDVKPYKPDMQTYIISSVVLEVDFLSKKGTTTEPFDTDEMARSFTMQFHNLALTVGMQLVFSFMDKKILSLVPKEIEVSDIRTMREGGDIKVRKCNFGICQPNTACFFVRGEGSTVMMIGKSQGRTERVSIINPDWNFEKMGIGGLDNQFNAIFRRAFASRVFPPEVVEQLGCKHVKGILLYGPPGTGKTLMARQIGKMLNSREPKIVNGPQILDKYVGESEANVRRLFADAEEEEKRLGPNSGLHIIIFDEIDAICKARGSVAGASGVHDTVVNQLLAKIDGVDQLNNILVIGMTNRRDMIDEALMRPGRLEVQMEIGLPNEHGRLQILVIHTARMRMNKKLGADVNLEELATLTRNFSGAEIEGLVRAAQSTALNRLIKASSKVEVDPNAADKLMVSMDDFRHALENDIKAAFGTAEEVLDQFMERGIIEWGEPVRSVLEDGRLLIQQVQAGHGSGLVSVLLDGPPNSGKTALASYLAKNSGLPFVKICTPEDMVGFTESAKCLQIRKFFDDAYKSTFSCILVDNIERLLDYGPIGPRYSNLTLQALLVLLKKQPPKGRRLLVLCTSSRRRVLEDLEMLPAFTSVLRVPNLSSPEQLMTVLDSPENNDLFTPHDLDSIARQVQGKRLFIGIKKLLSLMDMVRQTEPAMRAFKLISKLEEEEALEQRV